ncbi:MAG: hypothetical protein FWG71_01575 [Synergistaceae bacterium]|nr:hypothetical protein [Synergistaceae bacterium]
MAVAVMERDLIKALAETDEIRALRKFYRQENESAHARRGIDFLACALSLVSGQKIYEGKEAAIYFEILDTRDFLKEKYAELSDIESSRYKSDVEGVLEEAEETLKFLEGSIEQHL